MLVYVVMNTKLYIAMPISYLFVMKSFITSICYIDNRLTSPSTTHICQVPVPVLF